ncbi:glycosyltransferase family 4 protein [Candidatus Berkelbacteria bacterium]|nr:glycosyltransferase family 4 protein [Candidatus Berkelbacteria bacterium]
MLIGIDASRAVKNQKTGTEYYSQEIIKALAEIDENNQYILYAPSEPSGALTRLPRNFKFKIMPFPRLWSQVRLSSELAFGTIKPDVVFEPAHTIPLLHHRKMVVVIHDLGFTHFPELYTPFERLYHSFSLNYSARRAAHIITPSLYTKRDLIRHLPIDTKKISVIYHGYDKERFRPATEKEREALLPFNLTEPYIFFIGRIELKKNVDGMIDAYRLLREEKSIRHKLVLAGKPGWGYEQIKEKMAGLPEAMRADIIELGYVNDRQYELLLKRAEVLFFPSWFEGFGMPVIEAMASGVPVITSSQTSLPEIAGNGAVLVKPSKPLEMAAALSKLIHKSDFRKGIILKGRLRANTFSWKKAAVQTLAVLEAIASN